MFKMLVYGAVCLAAVLPVSASADNSLYLNSSPSVQHNPNKHENHHNTVASVYRIHLISGKKAAYNESMSAVYAGGVFSVSSMHSVRMYNGRRLSKPASIGFSMRVRIKGAVDNTHPHIRLTWYSLKLVKHKGNSVYNPYTIKHTFSGVLNLNNGHSVVIQSKIPYANPAYVVITRLRN